MSCLPREKINLESVRIGRNTGADEFPAHAAAFRKFSQIRNFAFVPDGDKRNENLIEFACCVAEISPLV